MGNAIFRGLPAPKPLGRFSKNFAWLIMSGPHLTCKYWGQSVQRGRVCACVKWSPSGVYFFLFLGFIMSLATGRPVGQIVAVNGSNDAPRWPLRPFYGFVNKKNFSLFFTQNSKNAKNCITCTYGNFEEL